MRLCGSIPTRSEAILTGSAVATRRFTNAATLRAVSLASGAIDGVIDTCEPGTIELIRMGPDAGGMEGTRMLGFDERAASIGEELGSAGSDPAADAGGFELGTAGGELWDT